MTGNRARAEVRVTGVVQGVGFRPFVYRTAVSHDLAGWVKNTGDAGVQIELEGNEEDVDGFLADLRERPPPLSRVESVDVDWLEPRDERAEAFEIVPSTDSEGGSGTIPPDTGVCANCLDDIFDPDSRYHGYWATSCVDCGPRYTVIRELPYDRPTTTMDAFPMCADCRAEYEDPADRRYHAQTIACPQCGPTLTLLDGDGDELATKTDAVEDAAARLLDGEMVAIKGIGGTHLACDATDADLVAALRERTGRPTKPFALMAPSLAATEEFAVVTDQERQALTDVRRPIVLLEQADDAPWLDEVSPGLHTVGVMLPYSGLHHLLFEHVDRPLVMTSANLPGIPMAITTEDILSQLAGVVDAALVHDREILARTDDSVRRVSGGAPRFVRRSRGWVPETLPRPDSTDDADDRPDVLALGPEFDATVGVTQGTDVVLSQHVGDVDDPDTLSFHRETVAHLTDLLGVDPDVVACDVHPDFLTTDEADRYAAEGMAGPVRVQHHHAHAASVLAEHGCERAVVVAADGTGYGSDGTIWGGEVLDATLTDFERVGGLDTFRLPGGEAAIRRPARILASLLDAPNFVDGLLLEQGVVEDQGAAEIVREQATRGLNSPATTSAGRFLDAVSALLGVCSTRNYEGEPAMRLEAAAARGTPLSVKLPFTTRDGVRVVDTAVLTRRLADLAADHPAADVAATAQKELADGFAELAIDAAKDRGVDAVGFTGGVAYNDAIATRIRERVTDAGLEFLANELVPPGDGGIAYGQAVVASARHR